MTKSDMVCWDALTVTSARREDRQEGFPLLVKTYSENLINFYREAIDDELVPGVIRYQISSDHGFTWGPIATLTTPDTNFDYTISGGITRKGTLVICLCKIDLKLRKSVGLYIVRSIDEGRHWSEPLKIEGYDVTYGQLVVTPEGIALPVYRYPVAGGTYILDLLFSHDDGITWADNRPVFAHNMPTFHTNEASILWLSDRTLIGFVRNRRWDYTHAAITDDDSMVFLFSRDLGQTWSVAPTNFRPSYLPYGSKLLIWELMSPCLLRPGLASNTVTLLFGEREFLDPIQSFGILRAVDFDPEIVIAHPDRFPAPTEVWRGDFHDFGYPTAQNTPYGSLVVFHSQQNQGGQLNRFFLRMARRSSP